MLSLGRIATCGLVVALAVFGHQGSAAADAKAKKQIEAKLVSAMESYDLLEYESAKKGLTSALLMAKKKGLGQDPIAASVHVHLGIVYFSGFEDREAARLEFASAIEIDGDAAIPKAYATKDMLGLFEEIRADFVGGAVTTDDTPTFTPEVSDDELCAELGKDIKHQLVETAPAGQPRAIEVEVGSDLPVAKVGLYYRADGKVEFEQLTMGRQGGCTYSANIPAAAIRGEVVHYYVSVFDKRGKVIGEKGSKGSPNIMEVTAAVFTPDVENPMGGGGGDGDVDISSSVETDASGRKRFFITVVAGSGGGYVTGQTEATLVDVACCFAPALFHIQPEVGYYVTPRTSLSGAFRLGFPVGANVPNHATAAPSGLLRVRHGFAEDGTGFQVGGAIGGGIIRHTVKISNAAPGEDTDTTSMGPLLLGAGLGYIQKLGGPVRLVAELQALAGVPVVDELGCPGNGCVRPTFGAQVDLNLGLQAAF